MVYININVHNAAQNSNVQQTINLRNIYTVPKIKQTISVRTLVCETQKGNKMSEKRKQINFCIDRIYEILDLLRPNNKWRILYGKTEDYDIDDWKKQYLQLVDREDYFFIYVENELLYAVNVTGDSVLTAVQELITKLAAKF